MNKNEKEALSISKELTAKDKMDIYEFIQKHKSMNINLIELRRDLDRLVYNSKKRLINNIKTKVYKLFKNVS